MTWVKQPPPPYVRGKIEAVGGWIIDHEAKSISVDYNYVMVRQDLHTVLFNLDKLEPFPQNVPYVTLNGRG
jgi:hypothetical protein